MCLRRTQTTRSSRSAHRWTSVEALASSTPPAATAPRLSASGARTRSAASTKTHTPRVFLTVSAASGRRCTINAGTLNRATSGAVRTIRAQIVELTLPVAGAMTARVRVGESACQVVRDSLVIRALRAVHWIIGISPNAHVSFFSMKTFTINE